MTPALLSPPAARDCAASIASDRTLMRDLAAGDTGAFEELYRRHHGRVLMQARKVCASPELAEEVASDAFLALWRGAHLYRPERGNVSSWLSGMVRNRAVDAWRRTTSRPTEVAVSEHGARQLESTAAPAEKVERAALLGLIADLPSDQREAVFLAYFGELTHVEIATRTDQPLGTVKSRIRLGIEKLRCGATAAAIGYERALPA